MKIAIAGYGVEGKVNYLYFREKGEITIVDEQLDIDDIPEGVDTILGNGCFSKLEDFDLVIRTASLAPNKIVTNGKVWSATNEFFAGCPARIIGVTGTKGKGTTCSLIAGMLRSAGKTVHLVGNIGIPALSVLPHITSNDIVVFELSSFQLWDIKKSPDVAVVLMVEPDHLNVHADFEDYVSAKANIARFQRATDSIIYHPTNENSAKIANLSLADIKKRYLTPEAAHIENNEIIINEQSICSVKDVALLGEYNLQNICAAISAAWIFTQNQAAVSQTVHDFKGLEHRLEYVGTKQGIKFYNDSFSSAPTATIAAITAFNDPVVLIVGGFDRGLDLTPLAEKICQTSVVKKVIIIGQVKEKLAKILNDLNYDRYEVTSETEMPSIVSEAVKAASSGDVILLSPGCASFDMYKNFVHRGLLFKQAIGALDE
ncbi:MAG: UDP-N-acetylmuramoyl-L-alanine--D-glutamate ligase [Candidatus Saccharimonadales bacterium]